MRETEQFLQRQITKLYSENAPDYLKEMQRGNTSVQCAELLQKIRDDKTTVGYTGEVCLFNIEQQYKQILKGRDQSDRNETAKDLTKLIHKDIKSLVKKLATESEQLKATFSSGNSSDEYRVMDNRVPTGADIIVLPAEKLLQDRDSVLDCNRSSIM